MRRFEILSYASSSLMFLELEAHRGVFTEAPLITTWAFHSQKGYFHRMRAKSRFLKVFPFLCFQCQHYFQRKKAQHCDVRAVWEVSPQQNSLRIGIAQIRIRAPPPLSTLKRLLKLILRKFFNLAMSTVSMGILTMNLITKLNLTRRLLLDT